MLATQTIASSNSPTAEYIAATGPDGAAGVTDGDYKYHIFKATKAANVGFDWEKMDQVLSKVDEEIDELKESIIENKGINEELGDVLFTIVNLSRHLDINPEQALNESTNKFIKRFKRIEKDLKDKKIDIKELSLEELDVLWEKNK